MRYAKYFLAIIFLLLINSTRANDTTLLYKQRIQQIQNLYKWIAEKPTLVEQAKIDTNSIARHVYDTAINLFFNRQFLDSVFAIDTSYFTVPAKFEMIKSGISALTYIILCKIQLDQIYFKPAAYFAIKNTPFVNQHIELPKDEIVLYFIIENREIQYLHFVFFENNAKLYWVSFFGYDTVDAQLLTKYLREHYEHRKDN